MGLLIKNKWSEVPFISMEYSYCVGFSINFNVSWIIVCTQATYILKQVAWLWEGWKYLFRLTLAALFAIKRFKNALLFGHPSHRWTWIWGASPMYFSPNAWPLFAEHAEGRGYSYWLAITHWTAAALGWLWQLMLRDIIHSCCAERLQ